MEVSLISDSSDYWVTKIGNYIVLPKYHDCINSFTACGIYLGLNDHRALTEAEAIIASKFNFIIPKDLSEAYEKFVKVLKIKKSRIIYPGVPQGTQVSNCPGGFPTV